MLGVGGPGKRCEAGSGKNRRVRRRAAIGLWHRPRPVKERRERRRITGFFFPFCPQSAPLCRQNGAFCPRNAPNLPRRGPFRPRFGAERSRFGAKRSRCGAFRSRSGAERPRFGAFRSRSGAERSRFGPFRSRFGASPPGHAPRPGRPNGWGRGVACGAALAGKVTQGSRAPTAGGTVDWWHGSK